jgi:Flp pilus assembly protein TadG
MQPPGKNTGRFDGYGIMRATIREFFCDWRAVSAVEFAITAPVLIGILIPTTDLGLAFAKKTQLHNAAQAGAQYALANGWDSTGIKNAVMNATKVSPITLTPAPQQTCGCPTSSGITIAQCGSVCPDLSDAGTYVTVSAQTVYNPVFPYPIMGSALTLSASTMIRIK